GSKAGTRGQSVQERVP
ncbi:hypothetical protein AB1N83_014125, partial [Pleurotus pulmonarius]